MSVPLRMCQNQHPFGAELSSASNKKAVAGVKGSPFILLVIHFIVN